MTTRSYETLLALEIGGRSTELECVLHYEHSEATGDGWNEPRYGESVSLERIEATAVDKHGKTQTVQLLALLSPQYVRSLEHTLLQHEEGERQFRRDAVAEARRDNELESA